MSIASYSELLTSVANWTHDDNLTAQIPDFVTFGENRIYRDLRLRCMETEFSTAISAGVLAVPSTYIEMKFAYVNASSAVKLTRKDSEWIYTNYPTRSSDRQPLFFARQGENFIFGPYPDSGYTVKGVYYARLTALSGSNETNWFTSHASDLLLAATMLECMIWIQDDARVALWELKYNAIKDRLQLQDNIEEFSGSRLSVSPG